MKNVIIEYKELNGSHRGTYRSLIAMDGEGARIAGDLTGMNPVDFIEQALIEIVRSTIRNGDETEEITVELPEGIALTSPLETHLNDKFSADPKVVNVTFA